MIEKFSLKELLADSSVIKKYKDKSILYRFINISNNKNYIGTSKNNLYDRLNNLEYGHITYFNIKSNKCNYMYLDMNKNPDNFQFIIEYELDYTEDNYNIILNMETEYIIKYDSVLNGYNISKDGKPGWKEGTICVNKNGIDYYIDPNNLSRFISNGFKVGRHYNNDYFLKGRVYMNNGESDKMVYPKDIDKMKNLGYEIGRILSPNKGKVWRNNGIKSKLIDIDKLDDPEFSEFTGIGRIEPPRKSRGKYNSEKKTKVNNGVIEMGIPVSELNKFLENNPTYMVGRLSKGNIIITNDELGITKYIKPEELDLYLDNGYRLGRKRKK